MTLCSFEGASGSHYDYALLNHKVRSAFPMGGGNYLFARPLGAGLEVICAGETQNIWNVFVSTALWETAKRKHGATVFYIHMNPDQEARALESADLVRKYLPPMNVNLQEEVSS
jgi:hypothetical protein